MTTALYWGVPLPALVTPIVRRCPWPARGRTTRRESYRGTAALRFPWKPHKSYDNGDWISNEDCGWASAVGKGESRILSRRSAII